MKRSCLLCNLPMLLKESVFIWLMCKLCSFNLKPFCKIAHYKSLWCFCKPAADRELPLPETTHLLDQLRVTPPGKLPVAATVSFILAHQCIEEEMKDLIMAPRKSFSPKPSLMQVILWLRLVDSPPIWTTVRFFFYSGIHVLKRNKWPAYNPQRPVS